MSNKCFQELVNSYVLHFAGNLSAEEVEEILRKQASQYGGCISCCYSICYSGNMKANPWLMRGCQLGLNQGTCRMHKKFPEKGGKYEL